MEEKGEDEFAKWDATLFSKRVVSKVTVSICVNFLNFKLFFILLLFSKFLAMLHGLWDLRSLTRGQTSSKPVSGSIES